MSDPPVPIVNGEFYPYPDQPLILYDATASFGASMRTDIDLVNMPNPMAPMGPCNYTYFPYVVTIYSPVQVTASITMQFI